MRIPDTAAVIGLCLLGIAGCASDGGPDAAGAGTGPELKYGQKGPVCMCSGGLTEAEIKAASDRASKRDLPGADKAVQTEGNP